MKLLLIVLLLCFQLNTASSQVVLTNATNGFVPDYSVWLYYNWGDNPGYYPASANYTDSFWQIWDFHDMTIFLSERLDYGYCSSDSTEVRRPAGLSLAPDGCVMGANDYAVIPSDNTFTYNVPDTLMKFPLKWGDHFATSYYAINPISTSSFFETQYGSSSTVVNGEGKLILPYGTFDDVLRLKIISDFTDSSHSTADTIVKLHRVQYRWYAPTQRECLMIIDTSYGYIGYFPYPYQNSIMSGYILTHPLAVNNLSKTDDVKIYPNPATTQLTISSPENITAITINNLLGQTVYSQLQTANCKQLQLDVAALPSGVYFVKINGAEVRKFVKG
jgi:hypothetical protein